MRGIRIDDETWRCACPDPTNYNEWNNTQPKCSVCGATMPPLAEFTFELKTKKDTMAECDVCWGTGFYQGMGAPCSNGCTPPVEKVGLHVGADEGVDFDVPSRSTATVDAAAFAVGDMVRICTGVGAALTTKVISVGTDEPLHLGKLGKRRHNFLILSDCFWFEHQRRLWPCCPSWDGFTVTKVES